MGPLLPNNLPGKIQKTRFPKNGIRKEIPLKGPPEKEIKLPKGKKKGIVMENAPYALPEYNNKYPKA